MIEFVAESDRATGAVIQCLQIEYPTEGNPFRADYDYLPLPASVDWGAQPSPTSQLVRIGDAVEWRETASLAAAQAAAIDAIDAAGEALRLAVINRMTTQTEEYRRVEPQARAWRAAGYPESDEAPAPRGVRGWAAAKWREGWTNRQACDDILATADSWYEIIDTIRDLRLMNKEDVRNAAAAGEIATIVADMEADVRLMAAQLQLTLTA